VLTPPPGFVDRSEGATWAGDADSPTVAGGRSGASPWGAASAPARINEPVDFGPRYRVEKLLGQGGMGAVYKAYDVDLDRTVALKLVRPELMSYPGAMARFRQELLLASKISHRNILRIHDLGDASGLKFISMAYVDGEDLHHVLIREGRLPIPRVLHLAKQLCAALDAAHSENVVHRDLKPQNIMLGAGDLVQVSDFGLAKSVGSETGMTQSGEMLGTPRYMAPEQVEAKSVDARTDIYALGLIFYEMVTGDVPFTAETTLQLMYKRAHETPPPPNSVVPDLPLWLNNIIVKCLECDPGRRYQSARDILSDLENERGPELTQATAPTTAVGAPVYPRPTPGNKRWIIGSAAAIVVIGGTLSLPPVRHFLFRSNAAQEQSQSPALKSLAILPLRVSGESSQDLIMADGIVDALSAKLFQLKDVHLASPNDVARLKSNLTPQQMGKALGVNLILEGSLQAQDDKLSLVLNLDDVKTGNRLWTREFTGMSTDILTIEDTAFTKLLEPLALKPGSDELARTSAHSTEKVSAYEEYLRGRNALRGKIDASVAETAMGHFERALKEDPEFALAYSGVADASLRMYKETNEPKWASRAVAAAERAGTLGPNLPEVHFVLSSVYASTGKTNEAVAEINEALRLAPNSDEGYRRLGDALRASDEQASIGAYKKAIEINPYYWYNYNALGSAYFRFGKDDLALQAYQKVTEIAPTIPSGYANMGAVYLRDGKYDQASQQFESALKQDPNFTVAISGLGNAYLFNKRYADAARMFEKQVSLNPNDETGTGNLGDAYRWAGDQQKANATYDRAIALAQKNLQVNPRDAETMGSLALYYGKKGDATLAQQYIRRARAINGESVELIYIQGVVEALAGRDDEAVKTLTESFAKGYPVDQARTDRELDRLQQRPEFAKLLRASSPK
jgi:serine/threonine protein kinase/tetratricopeptide (TPR) repeat protein